MRTRTKVFSMAEPQPPFVEGEYSSPETAASPQEYAIAAPDGSYRNPEIPIFLSEGTDPNAKSIKVASKRKRVTRRSKHICSSVTPSSRKKDGTQVIEEVNWSEQAQPEEVHRAEAGETKLQEKVKSLSKLLQTQQQTVEELKSMVMNDAGPSGEVSYKDLYMEAQKKIEALQNEKQELVQKLESAMTKLEVIKALWM